MGVQSESLFMAPDLKRGLIIHQIWLFNGQKWQAILTKPAWEKVEINCLSLDLSIQTLNTCALESISLIVL